VRVGLARALRSVADASSPYTLPGVRRSRLLGLLLAKLFGRNVLSEQEALTLMGEGKQMDI